MKHLIHVVLSLIILVAAFSCSGRGGHAAIDMLQTAEQSFDGGNIRDAQMLADSLASSGASDALDVDGLCRLSMLLVRLAEANPEADNTAMAVRVLGKAFVRDSDSTAMYIGNVPYDMRAAVIVAAALADVHERPLPISSDTIYPDSIQ